MGGGILNAPTGEGRGVLLGCWPLDIVGKLDFLEMSEHRFVRYSSLIGPSDCGSSSGSFFASVLF
jgi:hypothetical protein